jgi:hypothetical protein
MLALALLAACGGGVSTQPMAPAPVHGYQAVQLASRAESLAFYSAVTGSLENSFGQTPQYLDPRLTPIPPTFSERGQLPTWLTRALLQNRFFAGTCAPVHDGYCDIPAVGVSFSFSDVMRHPDSDTLVIEIDQSAVRPHPPLDASRWYGWGAQLRYYLVPELDRWLVVKVD